MRAKFGNIVFLFSIEEYKKKEKNRLNIYGTGTTHAKFLCQNEWEFQSRCNIMINNQATGKSRYWKIKFWGQGDYSVSICKTGAKSKVATRIWSVLFKITKPILWVDIALFQKVINFRRTGAIQKSEEFLFFSSRTLCELWMAMIKFL